MHHKRLEYDLLLLRSGELSARRKDRLVQALARDPALRARAAELDALAALWRELQRHDAAPPPATLHRRLRNAAATQVPACPGWRGGSGVPYWKPGLALAAGLCLLLASAVVLRRPAAPVDFARVPIEDLDAEIADTLDAIDGTLLSLMDALASGDPVAPTAESEWDVLALELIRLEDS